MKEGFTGEELVRDVIERHPKAREVLARHGLDMCCGGAHPIAFAAAAHGVELDALLRELDAAVRER